MTLPIKVERPSEDKPASILRPIIEAPIQKEVQQKPAEEDLTLEPTKPLVFVFKNSLSCGKF